MKTYQLVGEIADFDYESEKFGWRICGPKSLKNFLAGCGDGETVEIEINSPGGLCVPGMEMANAIKNSKAHVVAHVTGIAASMASVIVCACDEIRMEEAAFMMIHDPWSGIEGNAAALRKEAQNLDQFKAIIMSFYRGKFARSEAEISALMSDETWMTGTECVAAGLKCELVKSDCRVAALVGERRFGKLPEAAAKLYRFDEPSDEIKAEIEAAKNAAAKAENENAAAENWEARYKGASKKITELQAKLDQAALDTVNLGTLQRERDDALARIKDLEGKLEKAGQDLADAQASVSDLTGRLDQATTDLAHERERAEHLEQTRVAITGGVLMPSDTAQTYDAKMAAAIQGGTVNDRMALRKQKAEGQIK